MPGPGMTAAQMTRLGGAALALGAATVVLLGTFVPLERDTIPEHVFIWPGPSIALLGLAASALVVGVLYFLIGRRAASLAWLGVLALGVLPAVPGVGLRGTPSAYYLYELRWWWIAAAAAWLAAEGSRGSRLFLLVARHWNHPPRRYVQVVLFAALAAWAVITMPVMRFDNALHGDEPKYLRYCETWYQGNGFRFEHNKPVDEWPNANGSALLKNAGHAATALAEEAAALATDVRAWVSSPAAFKWNRAVGLRLDDGRAAYFITGKRGGMYQSHMPGLSVLLMPGYYLDRQFLSSEPGQDGQVPKRLTLTNATMLLLYALCGLALFALLRNALDNDAFAAAATAVAMITLPTTSFAFQLYPEIPGALAIVVSANFVLFRAAAAGSAAALGMGAVAASLLWLHPRFLLVSVVFLVAAALAMRARVFLLYLCGWIAAVLTVGAYAYRLTGSWMPTAMYDVYGETGSFVLRHVPLHVLSNGFDRFYGVLPHSPLLFLALPGLAVLARQRPRAAAVLAALLAATWIPAAGHGLGAAGGTPGRHVLAVLPLMMWPIAVLVRTFRRSTVMLAFAAILTVLSIDAGYSYNRWHGKSQGRMVDYDVSGWKPNLAFPEASRWPEDRPQQIQLALLFVGVISSIVWAAVASSRDGDGGKRSGGLRKVAAAAVLVMAGSTGLTAITGYWYRTDYLIDYPQARLEAAKALLSQRRCQMCFSSATAHFSWNRLPPTEVREFRIDRDVHNRRTVAVHIRLTGPSTDPVFGRVLVDFGDGAHSDWVAVVGEQTLQHRYAQPGSFTISARLNAADQPQKIARTAVQID